MKDYQITVRFNPNKAEERRAAEFLQHLDRRRHKSRNKFLIGLINAYQDNDGRENTEDALVEKIRLMFREEIQDISVSAPTPQKTEPTDLTLTAAEQEENAASVLADLDMFG